MHPSYFSSTAFCHLLLLYHDQFSLFNVLILYFSEILSSAQSMDFSCSIMHLPRSNFQLFDHRQTCQSLSLHQVIYKEGEVSINSQTDYNLKLQSSQLILNFLQCLLIRLAFIFLSFFVSPHNPHFFHLFIYLFGQGGGWEGAFWLLRFKTKL